jgi:predicted amidohydrolase YtcJ
MRWSRPWIAQGFRSTCAIGDGAIQTLDAFENAAKQNGFHDARQSSRTSS